MATNVSAGLGRASREYTWPCDFASCGCSVPLLRSQTRAKPGCRSARPVQYCLKLPGSIASARAPGTLTPLARRGVARPQRAL